MPGQFSHCFRSRIFNVEDMKLFLGLILSALVLQTLAAPAVENEEAPEHMPVPRNEIVEQFREDIELWFIRFQDFYDRKNAQTRNYRLAHVEIITEIYQGLMTVFGDDIEAVRQSAYELIDIIAERTEVLGADNACLREVNEAFGRNSVVVGSTIQQCATYANQTLSQRLQFTFYPAHAIIQRQISTVPLAVIDTLSRGNVLQDEQAMIQYLHDLYEVKDQQWEGAVSQLLRWETNRWEVDGRFMIDEMTTCMFENSINYLNENVRLEAQALACTA